MRHCFLGVVVLMVSVGLSSLAPGAGGKQKGGGKPTDTAQAMQSLEAAHTLLIEAKHDYHGHRAAAAGQVEKALKALGQEGANGKKKGGGGKKADGQQGASEEQRHLESQATSDEILRDAQAVLTHLQHAASALQGQKKVQKHVAKAIEELQTAMKVR